MRISTIGQLDELLEYCKATSCSEPREGGNFYKVKAQDFRFPDGSVQTREYLNKKKATLVVPITEEGNVVFVVQPIALSEEGSLIEFPAGYWGLDENGSEAGKRELLEETGYAPRQLIYLGSHYQDPGSIKQQVDVYLALGCEKIDEQKLDKGEFIKSIEVSYGLAIELMDKGYLKDANSFIAFSKTNRLLERKYEEEIQNRPIRK